MVWLTFKTAMYLKLYIFVYLCLVYFVISFTVYKSFCFSQDHRMVGVGRDLCGSSSPTPMPKQGHLQQAAQHLV